LARFFGLARFFSGLAWFFSVWVQFGFFGFRLIKPNRTEPVSFLKILIGLIGFSSRFDFFGYFFFWFSRFNRFFGFFAHPYPSAEKTIGLLMSRRDPSLETWLRAPTSTPLLILHVEISLTGLGWIKVGSSRLNLFFCYAHTYLVGFEPLPSPT
jgi:hypothetical protein